MKSEFGKNAPHGSSPDYDAIATTSESMRAIDEIRSILNGSEWAKLMRNARDGGATSILACRILEKTMRLLQNGFKQVEMMMQTAQEVRLNTDQLATVSEDIKLVSNQSRIVSINAGIEANRAGAQGRAFQVVAQEMTQLSDDVRNLTMSIDARVGRVNEKITANRDLCNSVAKLFKEMNVELDEFRRFMTRVEELSVIQVEQLGDIEQKMASIKGQGTA